MALGEADLRARGEPFEAMATNTGTGKGSKMSQVTYKVIQHDGGWAYEMGSTISETYPTRDLAHAAAVRAAGEQRAPGEDGVIAYEDSSGEWREEEAGGADRPEPDVKD
jgi:hypothetical protein